MGGVVGKEFERGGKGVTGLGTGQIPCVIGARTGGGVGGRISARGT